MLGVVLLESATVLPGGNVTLPVAHSGTLPAGDTLTTSIVTLPAHGSASISGSSIVYTPSGSYSGGTDTFVYQLNDAYGHTSSATDTISVVPMTDTWSQSFTPSLATISNQSNSTGSTVSLQANGITGGGDLSYDASNLPDGLSIDPDSGLISGTIAEDAASTTPYNATVTATDDATSASVTQTFNWTVGAGTPSATLGTIANQSNSAGDSVDIAMNASDGGGYPMAFFSSALPAGLAIDPSSGEITGTISNSAASTTPYTITVTGSDGQSYQTQTFTWTINAISFPDLGDQTNLDGDAIDLAPTVTDTASGSTLAFSAYSLPSGLSINAVTGVVDGTLASTDSASSPYSVSIVATDGTYTISDSFNWTVGRVSLAQPNSATDYEGTTVSVATSATDNVNSPTYSALGLPSGLTISSSTGLISGTLAANAHLDSPYSITVSAADGTISSAQTFVLSASPQIALINPGNQTTPTSGTVSLAASASDHTFGSTLSYSASGLPIGMSISASTGAITGTATSAGNSNVTLTATDGTYTTVERFSWQVTPIVWPQTADQDNLDGDTVSVSAAASYAGMGTVNYSSSGLPAGLTISPTTGLISGTLASTDSADSPYVPTITANAGTNTVTESFNWEVDPIISITDEGDQTNVPGDAVAVTISASDAATGTPTVTFSASGLPTGLSINATTGVIAGTVSATVSSTPDTVTITATDGTHTYTDNFDWSIVAMSFAGPGDQVNLGQSTVSLALSNDVASGYTPTYSASGLPSGLSLNSTTGVISGTLSSTDTNQAYLVNVSATTGTLTQSEDFIWQVSTVVVQPEADQTVTESNTLSLAMSASALSGTLNYSATGLPTGLSINSTTGVISGTISAGNAANGPFSPTIIASNGTNAALQTVNIDVNPLMTIAATSDQTGVEANNVTLSISASETGATPTYSATGLPAGLSMNSSTGVITGTISTGDSSLSPYSVDVNASDGTYSSDDTFNWTITNGSSTPPTLPNPGKVVDAAGDNVKLSVAATAPSGDTFNYTANNLPDGLSIDPTLGVISGNVAYDAVSSTPYLVTVIAQDNNSGTTATQTFSWSVNTSGNITGISGGSAAVGAVAVTGGVTIGGGKLETTGGTWASFTDTNLNLQDSDFTATIDWGDGSTSTGSVSGANGLFVVSGSHGYGNKGTYTVTVTVVADDGGSGSDTSTAQIGDIIAGVPATLTVASFSSTDATATAADFTATINWGDGLPSSTGTVTGSSGVFQVQGVHTYAVDSYDQSGDAYAVSVSISGPLGESLTNTTNVKVARPPSAGSGQDISGTAGIASGDVVVASFTDPDLSDGTSEFSAAINWGDNSSSIGTITETNGVFQILGDHTYTTDGTAVSSSKVSHQEFSW